MNNLTSKEIRGYKHRGKLAMNELISIYSHKFSGSSIPTINAKDLYSFLSKSHSSRFNDWISRRIEEYGFVDDERSISEIGRQGKTNIINESAQFRAQCLGNVKHESLTPPKNMAKVDGTTTTYSGRPHPSALRFFCAHKKAHCRFDGSRRPNKIPSGNKPRRLYAVVEARHPTKVTLLQLNVQEAVMPNSNVIPFDFHSVKVRTVQIDQAVWFAATDVAKALNYPVAKDLTRILDEDEKRGHIMPTLTGNKELTIINESGLYHALFKSRKPIAIEFRKWVTSEVLPAIRKTGKYEPEQKPATKALPPADRPIPEDLQKLIDERLALYTGRAYKQIKRSLEDYAKRALRHGTEYLTLFDNWSGDSQVTLISPLVSNTLTAFSNGLKIEIEKFEEKLKEAQS